MLCFELDAEGNLKLLTGEEIIKKCVSEALYALLQIIPTGKVTTYSDLSRVLHIHPRAVAKILSRNMEPIAIPCHRVVRSNGDLGGYTLNGENRRNFKSKLLALEGVSLLGDAKVRKESFISLSKELLLFKPFKKV